MKIIMHYSNNPPFTSEDHKQKGLGGTENFATYVAKFLKRAGHEVYFYNRKEIAPTDIDGVTWSHLSLFNPSETADVLISFRMKEVFQDNLAARLKVLILADTESDGLGEYVRAGKIDVVMAVSKWQMDKIAAEEGLVGHPCWMSASNGIDMEEFQDYNPASKVRGMCIHYSTPERGLDALLNSWRSIESGAKTAGVQAELHLFSSFKGWGTTDEQNEDMCREIYERIEQMKNDGLHIVNHKHAGSEELRKYQLMADVFLYPTDHFNETYCISLTEAMAAGAIPVVTARGAMSERVKTLQNGFAIGSDSGFNQLPYVNAAIAALTLPDRTREAMRNEARAIARLHDYGLIVSNWAIEWERRLA